MPIKGTRRYRASAVAQIACVACAIRAGLSDSSGSHQRWVKDELVGNRWIEIGAVKEVENIQTQLDVEGLRDLRNLGIFDDGEVEVH